MGYNTKIDWCDSSWNPVTGCLHDCEYCYARGIAKRYGGYNIDPVGESVTIRTFSGQKIVELDNQVNRVDKNHAIRIAPYPYGFTPTLHRYRLDQPMAWTQPRTIFVCSMADLFGEWVPDEWIEEVFKACETAPWHRYLFMTKNPVRYNRLYRLDLPYLNGAMFGYTLDATQTNEWLEETKLPYGKDVFVSIEPIQGEINSYYVDHILKCGWVIVGAETGNRKGIIKPKKEWIDFILRHCEANKIPIFMKESLRGLMGDDFRQEFPWGGDANER